MALFNWSSEYSVSVARFDADHKKLFSLINELNDAMAERRGRFVVVRILQELGDYTRRHFASEEEAMRKANYAGLGLHIAEHRELTIAVEKFYTEYTADETSIPIDVLIFLRDWLNKHVLESDHQYIEAMKKAGIH